MNQQFTPSFVVGRGPGWVSTYYLILRNLICRGLFFWLPPSPDCGLKQNKPYVMEKRPRIAMRLSDQQVCRRGLVI